MVQTEGAIGVRAIPEVIDRKLHCCDQLSFFHTITVVLQVIYNLPRVRPKVDELAYEQMKLLRHGLHYIDRSFLDKFYWLYCRESLCIQHFDVIRSLHLFLHLCEFCSKILLHLSLYLARVWEGRWIALVLNNLFSLGRAFVENAYNGLISGCSLIGWANDAYLHWSC